jgi:ribosomal protein S12 methylthiotransferase accessory factor
VRHRAGGEASGEALLRLDSSYRTRPADDTIAIAEGLMPAFGISRVTDITRMDRLDLPVCASVRPRSLALRVHAGKGMRAPEARAGALMEAIEHAVAEPQRSEWSPVSLSVASLVAGFDEGLRFVDLAPKFGTPISPDQAITAVECEDLGTHRKILLPAELIFFPCTLDAPHALFGSTTNGLASGNSLDEATLHALFEIMERDALAMNKPRDAAQWVDIDSIPEPFATMARTWRRDGIDLNVRHIPNAFELPCFEAVLNEHESTSVNLAGGSGLHLDRDIALARAVCEAAQSRLSHIHGGRDDITRFYSKYTGLSRSCRAEMEAAMMRKMFDETRRVDFAAVPHEPSKRHSLTAVLGDVLRRLSEAGFGSVFRHRFRAELNGLHVVKVVVPKCENIEDQARRIGPRLMARITADA